jgi:uncharacterized protein (DUF433 family)
MELPEMIVLDPDTMGGKPCIRGTRVTVGPIVGMLSKGHDRQEIIELYPYLKNEDIDAALEYAAWRAEEREVLVAVGMKPLLDMNDLPAWVAVRFSQPPTPRDRAFFRFGLRIFTSTPLQNSSSTR